MKSPYTGITRVFKAFGYSAAGFAASFKSEAAFRQDCTVFVAGTLLSCFLPIDLFEQILLISALLLILLMELTNTAIECVVDRISPDYHDLSKKAKDIGSLLVLISFINAALIWAGILIPKYF